MNRRILSIIVFFSILLSACSGSDRVLLEQADAVMEEHPDSAIGILQEIDREHISGKDLPYYALLMTQAQVKTDVPLDSDSLISIAYRKFGNDWWGDKGIRANFYTGEVFFNQDKQRDAMKFYLTAYEESKRLGNDYWRAKSAERIADLFFNAYNYPEAARYRKEAIEYFGKADKPSNQRYAIADLAIDFMNDSRFDEAIALLDSAYNEVIKETPHDTQLLQYILNPRAEAEEIIHNSNWPENTEIISDSEKDKTSLLYSKYLLAKKTGNSNMILEIVDSLLFYQNAIAENIIKESVTGAERDFYSMLSVKNKRRSEFYSICFMVAFIFALLLWWIFRLRLKAIRAELEANIESFIEQKANSDSLETDKSRLEQALKKNACSIDELNASIAEKQKKIHSLERKLAEDTSIVHRLENNIKQKNYDLDTLTQTVKEKTLAILGLKNELESLQNDINDHKKSIETLERNIHFQSNELQNKDSVLQQLFREQWSTLNMLCNEYYEKGDTPNMRKHIIDCIEKELKKVGSKKGISQIETTVNTRFDGVIRALRTQCPHLSEKEISLATLIIAGLSGKSISYLMGIKTGNFYVSKRRLIDKIADSDAIEKERFIDVIS